MPVVGAPDYRAPLSAVPGAVGGFLALAGVTIASPTVGAMLAPGTREVDYWANQRFPNVSPSASDLIKAHLAGILTHTDLERSLRYSHGIEIELAGQTDNWRLMAEQWQAVLESSKGVPDLNLATHMWREGWLDDGNYDRLVKRNGLFDPQVAQYLRSRSDQLSLADVVRMNSQGLLAEAPARFLMDRIGMRDERYQSLLLQDSLTVAPAQVLELLNRQAIDTAQAGSLLTAGGLKNPQWQNLLLSLRQQIPGPSDLVRFALREGWDQRVVDRYGYDQDFPPELQYWAERQGLGWSGDVTKPDGTVIPGVPWPVLYWRAHWQSVSPTQSYEFLHRFRPDNEAQWGPENPGMRPFLAQDVDAVLKIADYAPGFRPYLRAASYHVLGRIDVRRMHAAGTLTDDELVSRYQDMGYTRADAERLRDFTVTTTARGRRDKLVKCIMRLYQAGGLEQQDAADRMADLGVRPAEISTMFSADAACAAAAELTAIVAAVRKQYLRGELSADAAQARLGRSGIVGAAIARYMRRWNVELTPRRRQLSTGQVMDALARGYIGRIEAEGRLANLGWTAPDMMILMADANRIMSEREAKSVQAAQRTQRAAAKELQRLAGEAGRQRNALVRELNRVEPASMLKRMAKKGSLSRDEYIEALRARFIPDRGIQAHLEDTYGVEPTPAKPDPVSDQPNPVP